MPKEPRFGAGQVFTAVALVGFSVPLLVADLLDPTKGNLGDARLDIADVGAHPTAFLASTVLVYISTLALLPATAGLWRVGRLHRRRLTGVGAGLVALGALGHAALVTFNGFLAAMPPGDVDAMAALLDRVNEGLVLLLVFPLLLALSVGIVVLTLALWRGRIAPLWCFLTTCVMFCGDFIGGVVPGARVFVVYGLLVVVTARLAVAVLRLPASAWNLPTPPATEPAPRAEMSA